MSMLNTLMGAPAPLRTIDLFAGAGGLTAGLAASRGRFEVVRAVEHDLCAAATYEANHGEGVAFAGSIEAWLASEDVPEVDVVIGGPPCQGFSALNRSGVGLERNGLWERYAETLERARPRWFIMENVARFTTSAEYAGFRTWFLPGGRLQEWAIDTRVLLAADYGAPQLRRRAFVLGHHRDVTAPAWPVKTFAGRHRTVADALSGLRPGVTATALPERSLWFAGQQLAGTFRTDELHVTRQYQDLSERRFRTIPYGGNRFDLSDELKSPCWRKHTSGSGDVMGRLVWEKPSVTIRTEFFKPEKGRYLHPTEHRAITHHEAARIQGFPDDYLWVGSKADIARQIGNAVPLALGRVLGDSITDAAQGVARQEPGTLFS